MALEIGVVCATGEERAALARSFSSSGPGQGPFGVVEARAGAHRVHLAQAGIGKGPAAALTAHLLTLKPDVDLIVFCGVAGGMSPRLQPGDLVVGVETATHDYGAFREAGSTGSQPATSRSARLRRRSIDRPAW